jgi:hypothetical protein
MFIIKCSRCGTEQEWSEGKVAGEMLIELAGYTSICSCGSIITEEPDGRLREIYVQTS